MLLSKLQYTPDFASLGSATTCRRSGEEGSSSGSSGSNGEVSQRSVQLKLQLTQASRRAQQA